MLQMKTFNYMVSALALLTALANISATALEPPTRSPFQAAAEKAGVTVYQPGWIPDGFLLANVQLLELPDPTIVAEFTHPDGRGLFFMQTGREGAECPGCQSVEVSGARAFYDQYKTEDGSAVLDLTLLRDGRALLIGLRGEEIDAARNLPDLVKMAESLQPVSAGSVSAEPRDRATNALAEAAAQASFPLYIPDWLPEYFVLESIAYSPPGLVEAGKERTNPEEIAISWLGPPAKRIRVLVQPPGSFVIPTGKDAFKIGNWQAGFIRGKDSLAIAVQTPDASILFSGDVMETTLLKVARSIKKALL